MNYTFPATNVARSVCSAVDHPEDLFHHMAEKLRDKGETHIPHYLNAFEAASVRSRLRRRSGLSTSSSMVLSPSSSICPPPLAKPYLPISTTLPVNPEQQSADTAGRAVPSIDTQAGRIPMLPNMAYSAVMPHNINSHPYDIYGGQWHRNEVATSSQFANDSISICNKITELQGVVNRYEQKETERSKKFSEVVSKALGSLSSAVNALIAAHKAWNERQTAVAETCQKTLETMFEEQRIAVANEMKKLEQNREMAKTQAEERTEHLFFQFKNLEASMANAVEEFQRVASSFDVDRYFQHLNRNFPTPSLSNTSETIKEEMCRRWNGLEGLQQKTLELHDNTQQQLNVCLDAAYAAAKETNSSLLITEGDTLTEANLDLPDTPALEHYIEAVQKWNPKLATTGREQQETPTKTPVTSTRPDKGAIIQNTQPNPEQNYVFPITSPTQEKCNDDKERGSSIQKSDVSKQLWEFGSNVQKGQGGVTSNTIPTFSDLNFLSAGGPQDKLIEVAENIEPWQDGEKPNKTEMDEWRSDKAMFNKNIADIPVLLPSQQNNEGDNKREDDEFERLLRQPFPAATETSSPLALFYNFTDSSVPGAPANNLEVTQKQPHQEQPLFSFQQTSPGLQSSYQMSVPLQQPCRFTNSSLSSAPATTPYAHHTPSAAAAVPPPLSVANTQQQLPTPSNINDILASTSSFNVPPTTAKPEVVSAFKTVSPNYQQHSFAAPTRNTSTEKSLSALFGTAEDEFDSLFS